MAVLGIVAEFNPFHNGHLYLLQQARQYGDFSAVICVMSGNFLQRGEPAICNKWARAKMALDSGVDLVIELPFCFAVRSAYFFARGAIQLLARTGVVTHVAFGSESGSLDILLPLSKILAAEPVDLQQYLHSYLARGLSYPVARAMALEQYLDGQMDNVQDILAGPNNILALEYLRVITEDSLPLIPLTITRTGQGYHSETVNSMASASAIRCTLEKNQDIESIDRSLPAASLATLKNEIMQGRAPVKTETLSPLVLADLRTSTPERLRTIYEVVEGLEYRIIQNAQTCGSINDLVRSIKSKRYSFTRISRILLYSLCDLAKKQIEILDQYGPLYLHILGFSSNGRKILQMIQNNSDIVVFNRGKDVKNAMVHGNKAMQQMLQLDIKATNLYTLLYPDPDQRKGNLDFTTSPVIH
ncbi:MAG TPA: nucleotidyltransferase [Syntrophomonadaceae bacterium]|nr:nucleotidyltransferase [Syntrophomonadaceae bacterium]